MDEHTEICIALGAAAAANCVPCFEHYFAKAGDLGIAAGEIEQAVAIAVKMRGGAHMVMKDAVRKIMASDPPQGRSCCDGEAACCR